MKIYTKTGDKGTTQLLSGQRVEKHHLRIQSYGDVDELNSCIGIALSHLNQEPIFKDNVFSQLRTIQNDLFNIGSQLACDSEEVLKKLPPITKEDIVKLENWIDQLDNDLPKLKNFILPGGHIAAAHLHQCRTVSRRAERSISQLASESSLVSKEIIIYINRLSDLIFCQSRFVNFQCKVDEIIWHK